MEQKIITASEVGHYDPKGDFPWSPPNEAIENNMVLLSKHLLPCPFCGAVPYASETRDGDGIKVTCHTCYIPKVVEFCNDFVEEYHIRTKQPHTKIPWTIGVAGTMTKVIRLWNQRAFYPRHDYFT